MFVEIRIIVQGARITNISVIERTVTVAVVFRIFNSSEEQIAVDGLTYRIWSEGGKEIVEGKVEGKVSVKPHSAEFLIAQIKLPLVWFFAKSLLDLKDRGVVTLSIEGIANVEGSPVAFKTEWRIGSKG